MKLPKLYKVVKSGKTQIWEIWTEKEYIVYQFGFIDGKIREPSRKACIGKNKGKSNETTPEQQAEKEAQTKWNQQVTSKGYMPKCKAGLALAKKVTTFKQETGAKSGNAKKLDHKAQILVKKVDHCVKIMKGKTFAENKREVVSGYLQPKYDGIRCLASLQKDGVAMTTSSGNQFVFLGHIKKALKEAFESYGKPIILDGEMYCHNTPFQDITAACRSCRSKPHEKEGIMKFYVFDIKGPGTFPERWEKLENFFENYVNNVHSKHLILSKTYFSDKIEKYLTKFEQQGFEGLIYRFPDSTYDTSTKYTSQMFKYKRFVDGEYEIIGVKQGTGTKKGCAVWLCTSLKGDFEVTPKCTVEKGREYFQNKDKYIGKMLTVKYQELSRKGIPRFPVGIAIRDYE